LVSNHNKPEGIKMLQIAKYVISIAEVWLSVPNVVSQTRSAVHSHFAHAKFPATQQLLRIPPISLTVSPHYVQSVPASSA
jgi:hypothetical protein